ncbi:hypothetical protein [Roseicyclus persicicus]|uniref:Uncharacterized protein n=1 Tax=Roseicyclus persicicus TaxID=2650661 RepID=A0A7X6GY15_9RHOB|nr:hypothetical protein [Roseibacterium persicicum]NKX43598.1 hypothetical protein [Roseibacterium persicicum]
MADDDDKDGLEPSGLVAKNKELLAEVKGLKARVKELEEELGKAAGRAEVAEAEVRRITLDEPVEAVLGDLFAVKLKYVMPDLREHFDFRLEDGAVRFVTAEGEPVKIEEAGGKRDAQFTASDVRRALEAHGGFDQVLVSEFKGGSGKPPGSNSGGIRVPPKDRQAKVEPRFGLR